MQTLAKHIHSLILALLLVLPQNRIFFAQNGGTGGGTVPTVGTGAGFGCAALCSGTPQITSVSFTATAGQHLWVHGGWCLNSGCSTAVAATDITGGSISNGVDTFIQKYVDVTTDANIGAYAFEVTSATSGTHTITLTFNATDTTVNYGSILVIPMNGLMAGDAYDAHGSQMANTTNGSCTSGNLNQTGELVTGWINTGVTPTAGSGFTAVNAITNQIDEYMVGGTSGSPITATFVNTVSTYVCEVDTFKHS